MSRNVLYLLNKPAQTLKLNVLPTKRDVLLAIQFERKVNNKSVREAKSDVHQCVIGIWKTASLPIVSTTQVNRMITAIYDEYSILTQSDLARRETVNYKKKIDLFNVSIV